MKTPNPKTQIPKEVPSSKLQYRNIEAPVGVLQIGISLALGLWALGVCPATDRGPLTTDHEP